MKVDFAKFVYNIAEVCVAKIAYILCMIIGDELPHVATFCNEKNT